MQTWRLHRPNTSRDGAVSKLEDVSGQWDVLQTLFFNSVCSRTLHPGFRTRTCNPLLWREAPYSLGHTGSYGIEFAVPHTHVSEQQCFHSTVVACKEHMLRRHYPPLLPRATVIVSALRRHDRADPFRDRRGFSLLEEVQTG